MILLAVDTSTHSGSVALLQDDTILVEHFEQSKITHSERLMPQIHAALESVRLTISDVDGFAVTKGPGSFTALRVGISTIQGLATGSGKPAVGVGTTEAIAWPLRFSRLPVCPVIDARKGQVFTARFESGQDGTSKRLSGDVSIPPETLGNELETPVLFAGNAIPLYREVLQNTAPAGSLFADPSLWYSRASVVGLIAFSRICSGSHPDVSELAATYVRKSDAELARAKKGRP